MKKMKWFSLALAALVLGACSSSDDVVDAGNTGQPQWNADGTGYINLAINLPTTMGTRAVESPNDNWNDGSEYDVKNATLILFTKGASDTEFKVSSAYDLTKQFDLIGSSTDAITSTQNITKAINQVAAGTKLKALVVLNSNDLISVENSSLKVNNTAFTGTLSELNTQIQTVATNKNKETTWHNADNGFLMANALLYTAPGENTDPSTVTGAELFVLADIDEDKIFSTEAEAKNNPATNIFVERVEAKVQVSEGTNANGSFTGGVGKDPDETNTSGTTCKYQILGWWLDNTNNTSKLTRDENELTTGNSNAWLGYKSDNMTAGRYRMVGGKTVGEGTDGSSYYRVYWGKDHNYLSSETHNLNPETEPNTLKPIITAATTTVTGDYYDYCFENTTEVNAMTEENLTRVIIKAKLVTNETNPTDIGDFYTINDSHNTIYSETNVKKEVAALLLKELDMVNWINTNKKENETITSEDFTVTLSTSTTAGVVKVTDVDIADASKNKFKDNADLSTLTNPNTPSGGTTTEEYVVTLANKDIVLNYYKGGETYYNVWIQHFGDEYTPLKDNVIGGGTTPGGIYGSGDDAEKNYLGRYGVLRNNWYQIEVTGIKAIGSPTVTTPSETPVDKVESYIACRINILPWAIRKQQIELK